MEECEGLGYSTGICGAVKNLLSTVQWKRIVKKQRVEDRQKYKRDMLPVKKEQVSNVFPERAKRGKDTSLSLKFR